MATVDVVNRKKSIAEARAPKMTFGKKEFI
jgi:hypothetical protein